MVEMCDAHKFHLEVLNGGEGGKHIADKIAVTCEYIVQPEVDRSGQFGHNNHIEMGSLSS